MKRVVEIIIVLLFSLFVFKCLILERYYITSGSMMPTIQVGEKVLVNKLKFGPRIYSLSSQETNPFYRLKGYGRIKPNDVILFNAPYQYSIDYGININYEITYCKRVLGTPGDRIGAIDGHYWNDKYNRPIGNVDEQTKLRWMYDSIFVWRNNYNVIPVSTAQWNIKNWGPLLVPAKGMVLSLNEFTRELYRQVIEYETGVFLNDTMTEYTFKDNYYFAVGDNVIDSYDSRYWGFIPEDFIIGIVGGKKVRNNPYQTNEPKQNDGQIQLSEKK